MRGHGGTNRIHGWLAALAVALPGMALAASAPDEEMEEILVKGTRIKVIRNAQTVLNWLPKLLGKFDVVGELDVRGRGAAQDLRKVVGNSECIGLRVGPAVHCELHPPWPQASANSEAAPRGIPSLNPAMMLFRFETERFRIAYSLVDGRGVTEGTAGFLRTADTLEASRPCADIPGNCERLMRITTNLAEHTVEMAIDTEIDAQKVSGLSFVMHLRPESVAPIETPP